MSDLIDRQAAIDALKTDMASLDHIIKGMSGYDVRLDAYVSQRNQVNCDIDTINNLPPVQPELGTNLAEVGTDCISRQQAIDEIDEWIKAFRENGHKESAADACLIQDGIIQLPPAQPKQRTGKWIKITKGAMPEKYMCSACGRTIEEDGIERLVPIKYPFCHCGAKMEV